MMHIHIYIVNAHAHTYNTPHINSYVHNTGHNNTLYCLKFLQDVNFANYLEVDCSRFHFCEFRVGYYSLGSQAKAKSTNNFFFVNPNPFAKFVKIKSHEYFGPYGILMSMNLHCRVSP